MYIYWSGREEIKVSNRRYTAVYIIIIIIIIIIVLIYWNEKTPYYVICFKKEDLFTSSDSHR